MIVSIATRERIRHAVPWWAKCGLKLGLCKLPLGYSVLRTLALAQHGGMQRPEFAYDAFMRHFNSAAFGNKPGGFRMLELGPGDSLFCALIAKSYGAAASCFVDVGPFANTDVDLYRTMADHLRSRGLNPPDLSSAKSLEDVLAACDARYLTGGLVSLQQLPDASFDFIFSNGVLQSVWRGELPATLRELRRLVHPDGATIHSIDLRDTMGQSLHHLRFSDKVWESNWFHSAGFYTNRYRLAELVALGREAGFVTELPEVNRWPALPVKRERLAPRYREMPEADLLPATIRINMLPIPPALDGMTPRQAADAPKETAGV
jgi:SAM-dependent methyltransferase